MARKVYFAAVFAALSAFGAVSASAQTQLNRTDPCKDAKHWMTLAGESPGDTVALEALGREESACSSTFLPTANAEICEHALRAADAYNTAASALAATSDYNAPKVGATVDFALAFDMYSAASVHCGGQKKALADVGEAAASKHIQAQP